MKRTIAWQLGSLATLALFAACGGGGDGGTAEEGTEATPSEEAAPVVDPAVAATITGSVTFEGDPPPAETIDMSEEPVCADKHDTPPTTRTVVVGPEGGLANVFVYVKEGLTQEFPTAGAPVELDQRGCIYHPHVLGLMTDQPLLIRNSDAVLHNINTQPTANRGFNISQPQAGMESTRDFSRPEVMIPVKCDVHGWMSAYLGVVEHPFHAVSASDGGFELAGLPPGEYVVEAWHERYGTATETVTVGEAGTAEVSFVFDESMAGREVPLGEPLVLGHEAHAAAGR